MKDNATRAADALLWIVAGISWAAYMYTQLIWLNPFTW